VVPVMTNPAMIAFITVFIKGWGVHCTSITHNRVMGIRVAGCVAVASGAGIFVSICKSGISGSTTCGTPAWLVSAGVPWPRCGTCWGIRRLR